MKLVKWNPNRHYLTGFDSMLDDFFNDGWNLLKEIDHSNEIKNITHIFYTHEHPDHFRPTFFASKES